MSGFYPFDVKPETFYEKGDFEVVYGFSADNCGWRVGMRWLRSCGSGSGYPVTRSGEPCYFFDFRGVSCRVLGNFAELWRI